MDYKSPLNYFRDQYKNPDLYPPDLAEKREIQEMIKADAGGGDKNADTKEKVVKAEKEAVYGPDGAAYEKTIDIIKKAGLKPEFKDNLNEQKIIEQRKIAVFSYLSRILEDVKNYLSQVNFLQIQKAADYEDPEKYQQIVGESDQLRRSYHNKLIQDIKIASRLININFNADFPEDLRLAEESKMTDRQGMKPEDLKKVMEQREYLNFPYPAGIFIDMSRPPKNEQAEREYIGYWALKIYSDLSVLEKEIKSRE